MAAVHWWLCRYRWACAVVDPWNWFQSRTRELRPFPMLWVPQVGLWFDVCSFNSGYVHYSFIRFFVILSADYSQNYERIL